MPATQGLSNLGNAFQTPSKSLGTPRRTPITVRSRRRSGAGWVRAIGFTERREVVIEATPGEIMEGLVPRTERSAGFAPQQRQKRARREHFAAV